MTMAAAVWNSSEIWIELMIYLLKYHINIRYYTITPYNPILYTCSLIIGQIESSDDNRGKSQHTLSLVKVVKQSPVLWSQAIMATFSLQFPPAKFSTLGESGVIRREILSCRRIPGSLRVLPHASTSSEVGILEKPRWIGETPLSRLVGALIGFKPLFNIMKYFARQVLIR